MIGFGLIGWIGPSSVPVINGNSLTGLVGVRRASDRRRRKRSECERERVRVVFGAAEVAAFSYSIQQLK